VGVEIFETVLIGPALRNAGEGGGAIVEFAFNACVLKFIREKTRDGVGVVLLKRLCPGTLEVKQRSFSLGLAGAGSCRNLRRGDSGD
jgi:hypothetical protein